MDTFDGKLHIEWDPTAAATPIGQLLFFIQFLKLGNRFEPWVKECPLFYNSNNAPTKTDVLGSLLLSALSGHTRYSHITTLMSDTVNSTLLGMNKVVSDDSARRALKKIDERDGIEWLQHHLHLSYAPLLNTPWILDTDVTIKPLYGHQQGAVLGYNPHKTGRPSHTYHTYMIANLKLILNVEVQPGDQAQTVQVQVIYRRLAAFFNDLKSAAPQLTPQMCWERILAKAMESFSTKFQSKLINWLPAPA